MVVIQKRLLKICLKVRWEDMRVKYHQKLLLNQKKQQMTLANYTRQKEKEPFSLMNQKAIKINFKLLY